MSVIDTRTWAEFRIGDLFEVINGRKYPLTWRVPGDIPLVSTSRLSNGVSDFVGFPVGSDYGTHSDVITVAYSGSVGATFYHRTPVFIGETVMGLIPKNGTRLGNDDVGLFVSTVIEKVMRDYTYDRKVKVSEVRDYLTIPLPVSAAGNPDWDFMETRMRTVRDQQDKSLDLLMLASTARVHSLDTDDWASFPISSLFEVVKGTRLTKGNMRQGDIRHIGASQFDNGITAMISNDESVHPGNLLTVCYDGPVGTTFYQAEQFWATDAVNVLYPKFELNEARALFLIPVIQEAGSGFNYGQKWGAEAMKVTELRLPIDQAGVPDWHLMEETMNSVILERESALDSLQALVS